MKLLVGLDLSDSTEAIMKKAKALAQELSAEVWLMHVVEPDPDFVGFDAGPQSVRDAVSKRFREEHAQLHALADALREDSLTATALLVQGATVETVLKEAEKLEVDMIILGSHGRGAVYHLLVGSVSEGILHKARCPVLVVPTHQRS
jgi:nucleotide-binding universal stress UspA family protein